MLCKSIAKKDSPPPPPQSASGFLDLLSQKAEIRDGERPRESLGRESNPGKGSHYGVTQ